MKTDTFPIRVTEGGVSAKIRRVTKTRNNTPYDSYVVDYRLLGQRKLVWRSDLDDAKAVARGACVKIANGEHHSLTLTNADRLSYLRATEALAALRVPVPIDTACRDYADALSIIAGRAGLAEVCRDWIKRHSDERPRITVANAVVELVNQSTADRKSSERVQRFETILGRLGRDINAEVHTVTVDIVSRWLSGLQLAERTKRNYRDMIGFFCRFLVRRGYLAKGTDWLDGVQEYSARKFGQIEIYTPEELTVLLRHAEKRFKRMVPFLAIGAFAGLRHSETARLDWQSIELSEQAGESFIEVKAIENTKSDQRRRLVPIKDNLKAWLLKYRKESGPVCPYANTAKQLLKLAADAEMEWKHNALRHSCISYRVAECADVPRVSDESGNSVTVIRSNYLRRVKPAQAAEWFGIMPPKVKPTGRKLAIKP